MVIIEDRVYIESLKDIMRFIANDSKSKALNFRNQLNKKIEKIPFMPYKHRKSFHHDSEDVRDLIFKGYTVPYVIANDTIIILDIIKWINK